MAVLTESIRAGRYQADIDAARAEMVRTRVRERLWEKDHTLWKPSPAEIADRLGWLHSPGVMPGCLGRIRAFVTAVRDDGHTRAVLLGMGGSSLAPEVYRNIFGVAAGFPDLTVLDSTDPCAVLSCSEKMDPATTLFIVSTKSGGTVETVSLMKYFFNRTAAALGAADAGRHFIAITDPGSTLAEIAARFGFREIFLNDPDIGGRFSALSYFGLVPAALIGADIETLLNRAADAAERERPAGTIRAGRLDGLYLGAALGTLAQKGRDKLTFVFPPQLASFGDWIEQLVAESTGKGGTGILPVVGEPPGPPDAYGDDRVFVSFCAGDDAPPDDAMAPFARAGHQVIRIGLPDLCDLGRQIFLWQTATAVAAHILAVNPFDQPDVEAAKTAARDMVARRLQTGFLTDERPVLRRDGIAVYGDLYADSPGEALDIFLEPARPGDYIALQAYLPPAAETDAALLRLRSRLRSRYRLATAAGYGPRYLHSTGQLHKGDAGRGRFIQLTADDAADVPIPDQMGREEASVTFGILKTAQALGDRQALIRAGRPVIRFHLGADMAGGLDALAESLMAR